MKKIGFIFCFIILASSVFGQQFLWSTTKDTLNKWEKYVPLEMVTSEVLNFYDLYQLYFDGSGFSKDGFIEFIKKFKNNSEGWGDLENKINKIEDLTVFAFKGNSGQGSYVFVMCISKNNVNLIMFSNNYEPGCISTHSYERDKFARWFKTLLN